MNDKISVIVPAYNNEKELPRMLDSILAQTHGNIEVIVVNDGSTDGTGEVIDRYAATDNRIKAVHKENGGVTSARLRGVEEVTGDWIGFVDGDDYIEPDMYERLLINALEHGADISHCGYQMVFPSRVDYYYNTGRLVVQEQENGLRDLIEGRFVEPGVYTKLYRRELFGGLPAKMNTAIKINEDFLMNYWLFKEANKAVFEDVCPYHYILRPGSAATSRLNVYKLRDPLQVSKAIYADAEENIRPYVLARITRQLIGGSVISVDEQPELVRPYRKECRRELRRRLPGILACAVVSRKLKLMALFTAVWPAGYGLVHKMYEKISGISRKYEIS